MFLGYISVYEIDKERDITSVFAFIKNKDSL